MSQAALRLAEALADEVRPLGALPVDPGSVASALGIRIEARPLADGVLGATPSDARIVINAGLDGPRRQLVLAHEIAHVLVKRGRATFASPQIEERFADAFAEALLVPAIALGDIVDVDNTARELGVTPALVTARAGRLKRRINPRAA